MEKDLISSEFLNTNEKKKLKESWYYDTVQM